MNKKHEENKHEDIADEVIKFHNSSTSDVHIMTVKNIINETSSHFHLNEWWNGEGYDLTIDRKDGKVHLELTSEEIIGLKKLFENIG